MSKQNVCYDCSGSGQTNLTLIKQTCMTCVNRSHVVQNTCLKCYGSGKITIPIRDPCYSCCGTGITY